MIKTINNHKSVDLRSKTGGFSLIEIILAISIFSLTVMGLVGGLIYGQHASTITIHRSEATLLAQEGLEAAQNIAAESFSNLTNGDFGVVVASNIYTFSGNSDISDIYERQITVSSVDANTKKIESSVEWSQGVIDEGDITLVTYLTNWK